MVSKYESEIISLQNKLQSLEAQIERLLFEKNDLESSRVQMEESQLRLTNQLQEKTNLSDKLNMEVHELTEQSKQLRNQLQEATNELLSVTESSQECQRMAEEEKNVLKLELTNLAGNLAMMEKENTSLTAQLAASENNATSQSRDLIQAKSQITVLDAKLQVAQEEVLASRLAVTQLAVEKELRARAEVREDAERRERVAATAQAMALEGECSMRIKAVEEQARTAVETLNQQISQLQKEKEDTLKDLHESIEMITGLDNEVKSLKQSIDHASVSQEAHAVKELSRVTGELEIMRRRVKELSETQETHVVVEAKKIAEYEERLLASEKQRRKLHNLVQELRGNIRVFARVRPFLPSDGGHERGVTSKTIMPNAETNSVRIQRVDECRTEDQVFQFDKVFGPSFNQEGVFQEVSEFVQSALDGTVLFLYPFLLPIMLEILFFLTLSYFTCSCCRLSRMSIRIRNDGKWKDTHNAGMRHWCNERYHPSSDGTSRYV